MNAHRTSELNRNAGRIRVFAARCQRTGVSNWRADVCRWYGITEDQLDAILNGGNGKWQGQQKGAAQ